MATIALSASFPSGEDLTTAFRAAGGTIGDAVATVAASTMVDCSGIPEVPNGLAYRESDQLSKLLRGQIDVSQLDRVVTPAQLAGWARVAVVEKQLEAYSLLPVQVLHHIYRPENQYLIPESWEIGVTIFLTKFRDSCGNRDNRCVQYLCRRRRRWCVYGVGWLDGKLGADRRVAVLGELNA